MALVCLMLAPGVAAAAPSERMAHGVAVSAIAAGDAAGWDGTDRLSVAAAFARDYLPGEDYPDHVDWSGNVGQCNADDVSPTFESLTLGRINYFRAQAGVAADIVSDATLSDRCQEAALIMSREGDTSHAPASDFPSNPCLSADGNTGAAASNLLMDQIGPAAIDRFMKDPGTSNRYAGHRRWLLYSRQQKMGNGAIPASGGYRASHCNYVISSFKPAPAAKAVPWPNEGFVPWQLVPDDGDSPARWSFSYAGANFASATVSVQRLGPGGGMLDVTKEQVAAGYGDNSLVWQIEGVPDELPLEDVTYRVSIGGIASAPQSSFTYDVTVIDPYDLAVDLAPQGPNEPPIGADSTYDFGGFDDADGYTVRVSRAVEGDWVEGAEDSPSPRVVDGTGASYPLRSDDLAASGDKSFHLASPSLEDQSFTVDRIVVPSQDSMLTFKNSRRCATASSVLKAQISRDGMSWHTLWSRAGLNLFLCTPVNYDLAFQNVSVPIPEQFAGRTISVRFVYELAAPIFAEDDASSGFFIDDVAVTFSQELTGASETELPAGAESFELTPEDDSELWLQVRPQIAGVEYAYGDATVVSPVAAAGVCGDGSGDGNVTASDALVALKAAVGAVSCALTVCDVNDNGVLTASDALLVLKFAVGTPVTLDCPAA